MTGNVFKAAVSQQDEMNLYIAWMLECFLSQLVTKTKIPPHSAGPIVFVSASVMRIFYFHFERRFQIPLVILCLV